MEGGIGGWEYFYDADIFYCCCQICGGNTVDTSHHRNYTTGVRCDESDHKFFRELDYIYPTIINSHLGKIRLYKPNKA